jgi:hypothetical protein
MMKMIFGRVSFGAGLLHEGKMPAEHKLSKVKVLVVFIG